MAFGIFIGSDQRRAKAVYIGTPNGNKLIQEAYIGGSGGVPKLVYSYIPTGAPSKFIIKPYARCVLEGLEDPSWMSNDPEVIEQHGGITLRTTPLGVGVVDTTAKFGYEIVSYYELLAQFSNGIVVNVKDLAEDGHTIIAHVLSYPHKYLNADGRGYCRIFDPYAASCYVSSQAYQAVTCPAAPRNFQVIGYDSGTTKLYKGCMLEVHCWTNSSYAGSYIEGTTAVNTTISYDGADVPIELITDWGSR